MEEEYSRDSLMTALKVAKSLIRLSGFCACIAMFCMYVLYVSFGSKVRPIHFVVMCVVMGNVVFQLPDCSCILQTLFK